MVDSEVSRITQIVNAMEYQVTPSPWVWDADIPMYSYISDPNRGTWISTEPGNPNVVVDTGKVWFCDYCDFRTRCLSEVAPVSTTEV